MKMLKKHANTDVIMILIISVFLSYLSLMEYLKVITPYLYCWTTWHTQNLNGLAPAPLQYRVLSYMLPELFLHLFPIETYQAYLFQRFIFLTLIGIVFFYFLKQWFSKTLVLLQLLLFYYFYNLTSMAHIQPSEEANIFIFILSMMAIIKNRFTPFFILIVIGAFNKDTVVFLIPIYFLYQWFEKKEMLPVLLKSIALTVTFFAIYFGLRYYFFIEGREYLGGFWQYDYNLNTLASFDLRSYNFLFVSFIPAIFIFMSWKIQPSIIKATAIVLFPFFIGHFMISRLEEFRTFIPMLLAMIPGFFIYAIDKKLFLETSSDPQNSLVKTNP